MRQKYDALQVLCTCPTASTVLDIHLFDTHPIYLLVGNEITIGRGLTNNLIVMNAVVSREHGKLTRVASGWSITNVSKKNRVYVNDQFVANGKSFPVQLHDILTLESTVLQLIDQDSFCPNYLETSLVEASSVQHPTSRTSKSKYRRNLLIASIVGVLLAISIASLLFTNGFMKYPLFMSNQGVIDSFITLLIPPAPTVAIFALMHFINRFDPKPWHFRIAIFLWGACIAAPLAFFAESYGETMIQRVLAPGTNTIVHITFLSLTPGVVEESSKGVGLLLLLFIRRNTWITVVDGIVYGVLVGAGFALVENYWYFINHPEGSLATLILARIFLGWLLHSTFTACIGAAFGYAYQTRGRWRQFGLVLTGFLLAVGLHSFFDFVLLLLNSSVGAFSGENGSLLFTFCLNFGNYVPAYITQLVLLSLLLKALGTRTQRG